MNSKSNRVCFGSDKESPVFLFSCKITILIIPLHRTPLVAFHCSWDQFQFSSMPFTDFHYPPPTPFSSPLLLMCFFVQLQNISVNSLSLSFCLSLLPFYHAYPCAWNTNFPISFLHIQLLWWLLNFSGFNLNITSPSHPTFQPMHFH